MAHVVEWDTFKGLMFMRKKGFSPSEVIFLVSMLLLMLIVTTLTSSLTEVFRWLVSMTIMYTIISVYIFVTGKWRRAIKGTVFGEVVMKYEDKTIRPLNNIEIYYNSPFLDKRGEPVFTDMDGKFCFKHAVPVDKPITLEAKIGKNRVIYQHIGKIEGVKWFLGKPSLKLPLSSGEPKHVDFVVPILENY